jgi:hypothetical protein
MKRPTGRKANRLYLLNAFRKCASPETLYTLQTQKRFVSGQSALF